MKDTTKNRAGIVVALALATVLSVVLAGCGGPSSTGVASDESASVASSDVSASSDDSVVSESPAGDSVIAEPSASSSSSRASSTQGKPQISMGKLGLVQPHKTDAGVVVDVVIQVTNTGSVPLVMSHPLIRLADEGGKVILEESGDAIFAGPSCLGVGDVGFIYSLKPLSLPQGYSVDKTYLAQGSADLVACRDVHQYPVSGLSIGDDGRGVPTVTGTVTNDESQTADTIELAVAFVDNDGHMLGVASGVVRDLAPGKTQDFKISGEQLPVGCTLAIIADYDVMAAAPRL